MPIRRAFSLLFALSMLAAPIGAIELPDLGESARVTFSEARELRLGREIMREIRADRNFLDDAEINEYLNALGDRLAAASPEPMRRFEFFAVREASINAFALPGGFIGVHTGLIAATRNESELAGVLAHEIAHVTQNHIARIVDVQKNATLTSLAAMAVAILAARSNSQVAEAALATAHAANLQTQLDFTREHEREADRIGLNILHQAGFSPAGMATFFERLQQASRYRDNHAPAYLRTHPLTFERIADMQNRIANLPYRQHEDSLEYLLVRARARALGEDPAQAQAHFAARLAERPEAIDARYGLALAALRGGRRAEAAAAIAPLAERTDSPMFATLAAEIALANQRPEDALRIQRAALLRHGGNRPLVLAHARTLIELNAPEQALAFLDAKRVFWPEDPASQRLQARALLAMGRRAEGHLAEAEALLRLDLPARAMEQLQQARRAGDGDFFTLSRIDARMRELRAAQARETATRGR